MNATNVINFIAFILGLCVLAAFCSYETKLLNSELTNPKIRSLQKKSTSVIVTLTANFEDDSEDLCIALTSLSNLLERQNKTFTPVIIYHYATVSSSAKENILLCTSQLVAFVELDLNDFPRGYDGVKENVTDVQTSRFWNTIVWKRPEIQNYESIMRIDKQSCFSEETDLKYWYNSDYKYIPSIEYGQVYLSDVFLRGPNEGSDSLFEFATTYMKEKNIIPTYPELWKDIESMWNRLQTLPAVQSKYEISNIPFFRRDDVLMWNEAVSENEPFGLYRFGWDDAQVKVITLAMFATKDTVIQKDLVGYEHGHGKCEEIKTY